MSQITLNYKKTSGCVKTYTVSKSEYHSAEFGDLVAVDAYCETDGSVAYYELRFKLEDNQTVNVLPENISLVD